ncbi:hypothetical protein C1645_733869 [Glomus cerebriforme]|uniref:SigF-like NTF2-like domain-containing protein n=1 Tax=Glomus cerebriforme TaxID=658196 RepID=A0A397TGX9_9GLOM|nr:hypothetical protein C1645_733869 [Glomus cerebriforme]
MDDPVDEIQSVIDNIFVNHDKSLLEREVRRYYTPNIEFKHFLATIPSGSRSREKTIQIFKFYRNYNEENEKMFLDVTQNLRLLLYPWRITKIRMVVILDFKQNEEGQYVICRQEDFFEPEEIVKAFIPYFVPTVVKTVKRIAAYFSILVGSVIGT